MLPLALLFPTLAEAQDLVVLTPDIYGVLPVDVDADGAVDLVTHGPFHLGVSLHPNLGATFGDRQDLVREGVGHLVAVDLEGDGFVELCFAPVEAPAEIWCQPNVGGTLGAPALAATATDSVFDLLATDFDLDGDTDLLSIAWLAVQLHENDGAGALTTHTLANAVGYGLATGDLDGDADLDLLITDYGGFDVSWIENQGGGAYAVTLFRDDADSPWDPMITDVDGDGDLDPMVRGGGSDGRTGVVFYPNDGAGTFGAPDHLTTDAPNLAELGDINGDGIPDLITAAPDRAPTWLGLPLGTLGGGPIGALGEGDHSVMDLATGELDGDGLPDLVTLTQDVVLWPGDEGPSVVVERGIAAAGVVEVGDFDGDGLDDVVFAGTFDGRIAWHRGGAAGFEPAEPLASREVPANSMALADVDGDGDLDVAFAASESDEVGWWQSQGGALGAEVVLAAGLQEPSLERVRDLDADGDLDLVVRVRTEIVWLENLGAGSFAAPVSVDVGGTPTSAEVVDLDVDGDLDLAVTTADEEVRWNSASAPGVFGPSARIAGTLTIPSDLVAADLDLDGAPELLLYDSCDQALGPPCDRIAAVDGGAVTALTDELRPPFFVADLDGDQHPDLLGSTGTHLAKLLAATGFDRADLTTANNVNDLVVGDLDADGDVDLVAGFHDEVFLILDLGPVSAPPGETGGTGDTGLPPDSGLPQETAETGDTGEGTPETGDTAELGLKEDCGCGSPAPISPVVLVLAAAGWVRRRPTR